MTSKPEVRVSVISDYICPFCFIGHRRLAKLRAEFDLRINWCFVEIHPETPVESQPVSKLGYSTEEWQSLMDGYRELGRQEGIELVEPSATFNSRKALLLAEACKTLGAEKFYPLHHALFDAVFIEGHNIGDEKVLRQIASQYEIPETLIDQAWQPPFTHGPQEQTPPPLLPYLQYAGAIQARSVPTFVFGKTVLTGAVDLMTLKEAARQMNPG